MLLHAIAAVVLTPVAPVAGVAENGVAGGSPTTTLSKFEVLRSVVSWLLIARPARVVDIAMLVVPICVHVVPLAETDPVTIIPLRVSFSHAGAACAPPAM